MKKEKEIEERFIQKLINLKYIYRKDIVDRHSLEANFRDHFQRLNKVTLSESEFARLKEEVVIANVFKSSKKLREINTFMREDDTPLQYTLVNINDWCKNEYEVINQLRINTENSNHRYDVIILINGLPIVQIELKSLQISPKKAMEQIVAYKNDTGNGYTNSLLSFMQLFVVSNESSTYYFANNNKEHFAFNMDERFLPVYQLATDKNKKITNLYDFSDLFFSKCTLGKLVSRYMVLVVSEQKLLIMRPYQIYAVKAIMDCIEENRGNGYIWHTTGSGKTLTSFKASTLLKDNPNIEKCLFVVDRKDLDRQTREEFNKFQEGCVEENTNTHSLVERLLSDNKSDKVIVTTIQKLGIALDENSKRNKKKLAKGEATYKEKLKPLQNKRVAIIFDECHRSQFGDNHEAIKEFFPKAQLFGFTGTPIFEENATKRQIEGTTASLKTTKDVFQNELHAYTITHAIEDRNVLRFHVDYFKPEKDKKATANSKNAIVQAILKKHPSATNQKRFNAIFATGSIADAIEYYDLFKSTEHGLNIACVFSPPAEGNNDVKQLQEDLDQEKLDNMHEPDKKKEALKAIISDYNDQYGTSHTITDFDRYYQDVQKRIKDQKYSNKDYPHQNKIDITIVVDMLLTGFDSKYLNTLYVDKNLKYHGLIQAFSRTNRVLNDTKPYGNIVDFRALTNEVDSAIALFSGEKEKEKSKQIWLVDPAPVVVDKLDAAVSNLQDFMKAHELNCVPEEIFNLKGDSAKIEFISQFKEIQRLKTQLDQYTDMAVQEEMRIDEILPEEIYTAFRGVYLETAQKLRLEQGKKRGEEASHLVEEVDFEFVLFSSAIIDYDYIVNLISKYTKQEPKTQKMKREQLINILRSHSNFMDDKELIIDYVNSLQKDVGLDIDAVKEGLQNFKSARIQSQLNAIATHFGLCLQSLNDFLNAIIKRGIFNEEKLSALLEPLELGWKERGKKELELMEKLLPLLNTLSGGQKIMGLSAYEGGR